MYPQLRLDQTYKYPKGTMDSTLSEIAEFAGQVLHASLQESLRVGSGEKKPEQHIFNLRKFFQVKSQCIVQLFINPLQGRPAGGMYMYHSHPAVSLAILYSPQAGTKERL